MAINKLKYAYDNRMRYGGMKDVVLARDGFACVECGITRDQHKEKYGKDITINHIDGNGINKPVAEKNNALTNLETLCLSCHTAKDNRLTKTYTKKFEGDTRWPSGKRLKDFCYRGHAMKGENVSWFKSGRTCKQCAAINQERFRRSKGIPPMRRAEKLCRKGHPYDYTTPQGYKACSTCKVEATRRYRAKLKRT